MGDCQRHPPRLLAMAPLPPPLLVMALRMSSASPALLPLPVPTALPMSVGQFARIVLPSKTDVPGSIPQAISTVGTPAVQIAGQTAPWPFSASLQSTAIAVIVILVAGVHGQCHHPGKPVKAGGVVDQIDPACTRQVHQGAHCGGAAATAAANVWRGGQRPFHKCQQQPHRIGA